MKYLSIGQLVRVTKIATVGYLDDGRRQVSAWEVYPFMALIVGQVVKQTGRLEGGRNAFSLWDYGDYEPPHLKVDGTVTLWQVRAGMTNKPILVRDEDLEPSNEPFRFPRRAYGVPKRTYIELAEPPLDMRFTKKLLTHQPAPLLLTYQPEASDV